MRKLSLQILKISLGHYSSSLSTEETSFNKVSSEASSFDHVSSEAKGDSKNGLLSSIDGSSMVRPMTKRGKWAEKEAYSLGVQKVNNSSEPCSNDRQRWEAFFLLYEMLEEYGTHLVEAAWTHQVCCHVLLLCL